MLEVKNLKKEYKSKKGVATKALDDVSLNFPETGMVFILGKSGSGKSTLLNVCGGLDRADSGEIIIKGKSSKDFSGQDFDSYRNTYVGFVFQEYNILNEFTVEENIALALELQNKKRDKEVIDKILDDVDMKDFASRKPNTLSGGQKQRVAIARALVKEPEIIMADEPTGALDSKTGQQVFDTLKKLSGKKLVLVVSHDRDFAEQYGDRIIELKDGQILSDQTRTIEGDGAKNVRFFGTDTVCVNNGADITDEDIQSIAKFLKRAGGSAVISTSREQISQMKEDKPEMAFGAFENIKEQPVPKQYEEQRFIRSHLPVKHAVKMGASSLKSKPIRLAFTIFLSIIAFILFGLASTLMLFDGKEVTVKTFVDADDKYLLLSKAYYSRYTSYINGEIDYQDEEESVRPTPYTVDEYKAFAQKYNGSLAVSDYGIRGGIDNVRLGQHAKQFYTDSVEKIILVNDVATFAESCGRKPEADDEIAISDFMFDAISSQGTKFTDDDNKTVNISEPSDLLYSESNKITLKMSGNNYKVVGIYSLETIDTKYNQLKKAATEGVPFSGDSKLPEKWKKYLSDSLLPSVMVTEGFMKEAASSSYNSNLETSNYFYFTEGNLRIYLYGEKDDSWAGLTYYVAKYENSDKKLLDLYDLSGNKVSALPENSVALHIDTAAKLYGMAYYRYFDKTNDSPKEQELINTIVESAMEKFVKENLLVEEYFKNEDFESDKQSWLESFNDAKEQAGDDFDEEQYKALHPEPQKTDKNASGEYLYYHGGDEYDKLYDNYLEYVIATNGTFAEYKTILYNARQEAIAEFLKENPEPQQPAEDASEAEWDKYNADHYKWYIGCYNAGSNAENEVDPIYKLMSLDNNDYTKEEILDLLAQIKILLPYAPEPELGIINQYNEDWTHVSLGGVFYDNVFSRDYCAYLSDDVYDEFADIVSSHIFSYEYVTKYVKPEDACIDTLYIHYKHTKAEVEELINLSYHRGDDDSTAEIGNSQMSQLSTFIDVAKSLSKAFLISGLVLALFAFLLMFNFISVSITAKKKDIGILRAIGARTLDVYKIFMSESLIIALICFIVSTVGTFGLCILINKILTEGTFLSITILAFGPLSVLCIFGVALLTAVISTVIPVALYSRKPPVASIRAL